MKFHSQVWKKLKKFSCHAFKLCRVVFVLFFYTKPQLFTGSSLTSQNYFGEKNKVIGKNTNQKWYAKQNLKC